MMPRGNCNPMPHLETRHFQMRHFENDHLQIGCLQMGHFKTPPHSGREVTGPKIFKSRFLLSVDSSDHIHVHMKHENCFYNQKCAISLV